MWQVLSRAGAEQPQDRQACFEEDDVGKGPTSDHAEACEDYNPHTHQAVNCHWVRGQA